MDCHGKRTFLDAIEQLAKRTDVISEVFADPVTAGTTDRERAIGQFAIDLTLAPLDVSHIHAIAIFAWANRLMLNLGEPVFTASENNTNIYGVGQRHD
jgi:alkylhydroperoxidase family enzyme